MWNEDDVFCWNLLKNEIFHVTSETGWAGIQDYRKILPSQDGLPHAFRQTLQSYARKAACVSLFDFASCRYEKIWVTFRQWMIVAQKHKPTILLRMDAPRIIPKLIPNSALGDQLGPDVMRDSFYVPCVEAWHKGPIPLDWVQDVHLIDWQGKTTETIPAS